MNAIIQTGARIAAWLLAGAIAVLSLVPPWWRPTTGAPQNFEHFAVFFATGLAFGVGYSRKSVWVSGSLVAYAGAIELAQIAAPGRHARLSDFVVDAAAACVGAAMGAVVAARTIAKSP